MPKYRFVGHLLCLRRRCIAWITLISVLFGASICEAGLRIYYIRHAEAGHNVRDDWKESGIPEDEWPDYVGDHEQFTPLGITQLEAVSSKLQEFEYRFDFIAASPAWRSYNTIWPYVKEVGATGEIWPELQELSVDGELLFKDDLPEITVPILGEGREVELTNEEAEWFSIRPGGEYEFDIPDEYEDDSDEEAASALIVYQAVIDMILDQFDGTDKAVLLAGHGASGRNLIRLLTNEVDYDSIDNTGIWMVEQQEDGSFKAMIYASEYLENSSGGTTTVEFDDLRADLSDGEINGDTDSDSDVTITKAEDGLDVVYSLSLTNQDFDGVGGSNDSLSWDIRFKGFIGGSVTEDDDDSSVSLGDPAEVYSSDDYFGVSDERYVDEDDSIQFSVENVVLTATSGTTVEFNGFDRIYGSDDSYVFGVGNGLESIITDDDGDFSFDSTAVLTLSCPTDKFRVRDLRGSFTVTSDRVGFSRNWISKPYAEAGQVYRDSLLGTASGSSLTFSKVEGPGWLTVRANGTLVGTPGSGDVGTNVFKVMVENVDGSSDTMTLVIVVQAAEVASTVSGDDLNYSFIYFENGLPTPFSHRRPSSEDNFAARDNPDLVIQTGYYSLMLDCDDMELKGYDALTGEGYLNDLKQDVTVFTPANLSLQVTKDGVQYTCVGAEVQTTEEQLVRLIESNRYVQRFDHLGLIFEDNNGNVLSETGRFEVTAWADRVAFKLDFSEVSGVTGTSVRIVSPASVVHEETTSSDSAVLALQPHLDTTLQAWNANDYVTEARELDSTTTLAVEFDAAEYGLHIDVPADRVSYPEDRDRVDEFLIEVTNPGSSAQNIPLIFDQPSVRTITGTVMTLNEENDGSPLGIPVQISKNWHITAGETTIHQGRWLRGYTMLNLAPGETKRFRLRVIFGYWGDAGAVSHSQLSLIGWDKNWKWDESALGAWGESITYDPTMHAGAAFMADIRATFTDSYHDDDEDGKGNDHDWTANAGGGDFLIYRDSNDTYRHIKKLKTAYHWVGPNMTEVIYSGLTDDDKIRYTYTTRGVRTNDYLRKFHGYKYEFLEDVVSPERLVFHQMAADYYDSPEYTDYYIGGDFGLISSETANEDADDYEEDPFQFNGRWLSIDDTITGDYEAFAHRGLLSLSSTLNGTYFPIYMHPYGSDSMRFDLSSDSVSKSYSAGDVVEGEVAFIMPPKSSSIYWGSDAELINRLDEYGTNAWETVYDESRYNIALDVDITEGTLLRNYPVEIQASTTGGTTLADFTINGGGIGHVPVVLKGIEEGLPLLTQRYINGQWVSVETSDTSRNDDYQAYLNVDGTMDAVFNLSRPSLDLEESWRIRIVSVAPEDYGLDSLLVGYDFAPSAADSSAPTVLASNISASAITSPMNISYTSSGDNSGVDAVGVELGSPSVLGGLHIQVIDAVTNSFENAVAGNDYIAFTVSPDEACRLSLISFKLTMRSANSVDEFALTDAAGNIIGSPIILTNVFGLNTTYEGFRINLTGTAYEYITEPTEFRIYAWGRGTTNTNSTVSAIDKITLHGKAYSALAFWDFDSGSTAAEIEGANISTSFRLGAGGTLTNSSAIGKGDSSDGTVAPYDALRLARVSGWDADDFVEAQANEDYFEFVITPDEGVAIDFDRLLFSGALRRLNRSPEVWTLTSSLDGHVSAIDSGTISTVLVEDTSSYVEIAGDFQDFVVDLTAGDFQGLTEPTTFRLYINDDDGVNSNSSAATRYDRFNFIGRTVATQVNGVPFSWLDSYGLERTEAATLADTDGDGLSNLQEYLAGKNPLINDGSPEIRVTEYYLSSGDFSGTTATVPLDHYLADDYFILVRGSRVGDGLCYPDNGYARVTGVPWKVGDMEGSGSNYAIVLSRHAADFDWEGVVTVVECLNSASALGFKLVDIVETSLTGSSGTDTSAAWSDVAQVVLFGGYRGGGASFAADVDSRNQAASVHTRLYPSGSNTLNWSRNTAGETLVDAVMSTFVVEWGSEWTVQHVNVSGNNGGGGANAVGEYATAPIASVTRSNSWVWATGSRIDAGVGDGTEACLVTLGDGVNQNASESSVAVGSEYTDAYDFDVYVMTHPDIVVDYRFVVDGNSNVLDLPVVVDSAAEGSRFSWAYNGLNGTGDYHPRSQFWSRYTDDNEVTLSRGFDGQNFPAWVQGIDFSALSN